MPLVRCPRILHDCLEAPTVPLAHTKQPIARLSGQFIPCHAELGCLACQAQAGCCYCCRQVNELQKELQSATEKMLRCDPAEPPQMDSQPAAQTSGYAPPGTCLCRY